MQTTPHLLVGAAIGSQFHNPILIATAAAGSHFLLDSLPHLGFFLANGRVGAQYNVEDLDRGDIAFVTADAALGLAILILLTHNNPSAELIWLGAFCGFLPDLHHTLQIFLGPEKLKKYIKIHQKFHYKKRISILTGFATQVLTAVAAILLVLRHS